jgi:DNA modification methylase
VPNGTMMDRALIRIEFRRIADLVPYRRNPRKNDHAVERMRASLREYGFPIPILTRGPDVIDGHLRLKAAIAEGYMEVPVIPVDEWSDAQVKAFRLLVNRSSSWAEWDWDLVALELTGLKDLDFDLALTGFDGSEIDDLLFRSGSPIDAEEAPEPLNQAISQVGDLWLCGRNRVVCGDCTDSATVARLLGAVVPPLMVSDAPYGVTHDPVWREQAGLGRQRQTGSSANDDRADWSSAYQLFPGDVAYVWHAGVHAAEVATGLEAIGFRIRAQIIWAKQQFALSRGDYHWQHEACWYAVRDGRSSHWCGDRTQSTLWQVPNLNPFGGNREEVATGHSAQKPVELIRRPILNHTARGDVIYDPFLGSGTTLIAAELTNRVCYGLEIEPRYVDVIVKRWQMMTGKIAALDGTNLTFDQIERQRLHPAE